MIYRAHDCCRYDSRSQPLTTVWFSAINHRTAEQKLVDLLALVWDVDRKEICTGSVREEFEIERDSMQERDAGPRRLLECGWAYDMPIYTDFSHSLILLDNYDRRRLFRAWAEARKHAIDVIVPKLDSYAAERAGHISELARREADRMRLFATGVPMTAEEGTAEAGMAYLDALHNKLDAIARDFRHAALQRNMRKHKSAGKLQDDAIAQLLKLVDELPV